MGLVDDIVSSLNEVQSSFSQQNVPEITMLLFRVIGLPEGSTSKCGAILNNKHVMICFISEKDVKTASIKLIFILDTSIKLKIIFLFL